MYGYLKLHIKTCFYADEKHKQLNIFAFFVELFPDYKLFFFLIKYTLDSVLAMNIHLEMNCVHLSEKLFELRNGKRTFIINNHVK